MLNSRVTCPRKVFAKIARDFQMILFFILNINGIREVFSFQVQLMLSIFRLGLFYNEVLLDAVI
jgi:hypothetical protein